MHTGNYLHCGFSWALGCEDYAHALTVPTPPESQLPPVTQIKDIRISYHDDMHFITCNMKKCIPSSGARVSVWKFPPARDILLTITYEHINKQYKTTTTIQNYKSPGQQNKAYISFSAPLLLLFRLLGSRFGGGVWLALGGFFLISSFLCLSMSSRWAFTLSCCLYIKKNVYDQIYTITPPVHLY